MIEPGETYSLQARQYFDLKIQFQAGIVEEFQQTGEIYQGEFID